MSRASDRAVQAAKGALGPLPAGTHDRFGEHGVTTNPGIALAGACRALDAAHDPALGLDRSVCLRDVVEALRNTDSNVPAYFQAGRAAAEFVERHFAAQPGEGER